MTETAAETPAVAETSVETIYVDIKRLHANSWNPNVQNETVRRAERESIQTYGFIDPITVRPHPDIDGDYEIIDGEHRWGGALDLGIEQVPIIPLPLDDVSARKLTVILNETRGNADAVLLGQLLTSLKGMHDDDIALLKFALPYTDAELEHLLSLGTQDWDSFSNQPPDPPPPPVDLNELVLTWTTKRAHGEFMRWVEMLRKEWSMGESGVTEIVSEAVKRAALEANQGGRKTS